jgi:hypothetical protein
VVGEVDYVEISIEEFVIGGLFVFPLFVHEPNTVQAIHPAVISDAENASLVFLPGPPFSMWVHETHHG